MFPFNSYLWSTSLCFQWKKNKTQPFTLMITSNCIKGLDAEPKRRILHLPLFKAASLWFGLYTAKSKGNMNLWLSHLFSLHSFPQWLAIENMQSFLATKSSKLNLIFLPNGVWLKQIFFWLKRNQMPMTSGDTGHLRWCQETNRKKWNHSEYIN